MTAEKKLSEIEAAIREYHLSLDLREHGGIAADRAIKQIEGVLELPWRQGEEQARRGVGLKNQ